MLVKTSLCRPLVPVDGGWSAWGGWGHCDSECSKIRSRTCTDPPPFGGGAPCPDNQTLITFPTFDPSSMPTQFNNSTPPPGAVIVNNSTPPSNSGAQNQNTPPGNNPPSHGSVDMNMTDGPSSMPQSNRTIHYNIAPCCGGDCPGNYLSTKYHGVEL